MPGIGYVEQAPPSVEVRHSRADLPYWACAILLLAVGVVVSDPADDRWLGVAYLVYAMVMTGASLRSRVTLTDSHVVVRRWRTRRVAWCDVQAVVQERHLLGRQVVLWTSSARITLPALTTSLGLGRGGLERSYHLIGQWWLSHRGAGWAPILTATPVPRHRRYFDAEGNEIALPTDVEAARLMSSFAPRS